MDALDPVTGVALVLGILWAVNGVLRWRGRRRKSGRAEVATGPRA